MLGCGQMGAYMLFNRRKVLIGAGAGAGSLALPAISKGQTAPPLTPTGFKYFISGLPTTFVPAVWIMMFPTGSSGLLTNISSTIISTLNNASVPTVGVHYTGCNPDQGSNANEEDYAARYFGIGVDVGFFQSQFGFTTPPVIYAQSRGGLQALSFACEAPSQVARYCGLYPCTDPAVYPGRGPILNSAHSKTDPEFDAVMTGGSPVISRYTPNSKAGGLVNVQGCIWHGDSDTTVPKILTTDIFAPQAHSYVKTLPGVGHQSPDTVSGLVSEMCAYMQFGQLPYGAVRQGSA
jgi:hypothetical protein